MQDTDKQSAYVVAGATWVIYLKMRDSKGTKRNLESCPLRLELAAIPSKSSSTRHPFDGVGEVLYLVIVLLRSTTLVLSYENVVLVCGDTALVYAPP